MANFRMTKKLKRRKKKGNERSTKVIVLRLVRSRKRSNKQIHPSNKPVPFPPHHPPGPNPGPARLYLRVSGECDWTIISAVANGLGEVFSDAALTQRFPVDRLTVTVLMDTPEQQNASNTVAGTATAHVGVNWTSSFEFLSGVPHCHFVASVTTAGYGSWSVATDVG